VIEPWIVWLVHVAGCVVSVVGGGLLAGATLESLRSKQGVVAPEPVPRRGLPHGAGRVIGLAERFLAYVTVLANAWVILSVLVALKTLVRYPEVKLDADAERARPSRELRFAEYYLVGTLVSLAVGIGVPLILKGIVGSPMDTSP